MENDNRIDPPLTGPEKEMLEAYLDYHRDTLLMKVGGVSDEDLRGRPVNSSTITLLGLVKHLAYVERWWFQWVFVGLDVTFPWKDSDPDAEWRVEPDDTTEAILELYRTETARAREIVAAASLDELSKRLVWRDQKQVSLRWVMLHMLEEIARHNGHADLLREAVDGVTGE